MMTSNNYGGHKYWAGIMLTAFMRITLSKAPNNPIN